MKPSYVRFKLRFLATAVAIAVMYAIAAVPALGTTLTVTPEEQYTCVGSPATLSLYAIDYDYDYPDGCADDLTFTGWPPITWEPSTPPAKGPDGSYSQTCSRTYVYPDMFTFQVTATDANACNIQNDADPTETAKVYILKLSSQTVCTVPLPRDRTTIGIGEEVGCSINPSSVSVTWEVTGGGAVEPAEGNSTTFTAPLAPGTCVVHAKKDGADCTKVFTVIEPNDIEVLGILTEGDIGPLGPPNNLVGAWTLFAVQVLPDNVSFNKILFREDKWGVTEEWPNGTEKSLAAETEKFSVQCDNATTDRCASGTDSAQVLWNGSAYEDFSWTMRMDLQYNNDVGQWTTWLEDERHVNEYLGSSLQCRVRVQWGGGSFAGGWQGPWESVYE